jgi:hypothetical protein
MGSRKEGKDWNDWPTELWTLRGFRHPSNETTEIFKSAKWKGILDRTDGLLAKRDSILRTLPPEVRKTVAARLEVLEKLSRDSRLMMNDAFAEDYTDAFSMHRVGLGQHGVIAQLPKEMKGLHPPSDEAGRAWGGLRSKQGAMGKFTDYLGSMGPNHAGIITEYMAEQAGSSQNLAPHVMKGWIMKQRPLAKGGYAGKITDDSTFVTKFNERMKARGPAYAEAYHEAMAAQHALTFELLGGAKAFSNDLVAKTMRLGRSRNFKEPVGYVGPFTENPLESTFWADKEFHSGGAYAEWNVPHHRIFVTYWQSRPGRYNESGLCGDGENEFTAILAGLKGRRKR